mmetsp:Transcript_23591/g.55904  ORF Transcript_23591/g.55904 Transcript_23591/m.55904 type:complete len:84 (-) Transcript_23591:1203-1454(-)
MGPVGALPKPATIALVAATRKGVEESTLLSRNQNGKHPMIALPPASKAGSRISILYRSLPPTPPITSPKPYPTLKNIRIVVAA